MVKPYTPNTPFLPPLVSWPSFSTWSSRTPPPHRSCHPCSLVPPYLQYMVKPYTPNTSFLSSLLYSPSLASFSVHTVPPHPSFPASSCLFALLSFIICSTRTPPTLRSCHLWSLGPP